MVELRPHLRETHFVEQVKEQMREGYQLLLAEKNGLVCGVAGFVINRKLAFGKHLYIDDFVTLDEHRSKGIGKAMMDWLCQYAQIHECKELHLDSGVQRFSAHRFYFREKFHISSYHFRLPV